MRIFKSPRPSFPEEPVPLTDEQEWEQWRSFIGSKRTCPKCGLVVGEPAVHKGWHAERTYPLDDVAEEFGIDLTDEEN